MGAINICFLLKNQKKIWEKVIYMQLRHAKLGLHILPSFRFCQNTWQFADKLDVVGHLCCLAFF
jgi:hypothetical protein